MTSDGHCWLDHILVLVLLPLLRELLTIPKLQQPICSTVASMLVAHPLGLISGPDQRAVDGLVLVLLFNTASSSTLHAAEVVTSV
jgi:hypothetical protein